MGGGCSLAEVSKDSDSSTVSFPPLSLSLFLSLCLVSRVCLRFV